MAALVGSLLLLGNSGPVASPSASTVMSEKPRLPNARHISVTSLAGPFNGVMSL